MTREGTGRTGQSRLRRLLRRNPRARHQRRYHAAVAALGAGRPSHGDARQGTLGRLQAEQTRINQEYSDARGEAQGVMKPISAVYERRREGAYGGLSFLDDIQDRQGRERARRSIRRSGHRAPDSIELGALPEGGRGQSDPPVIEHVTSPVRLRGFDEMVTSAWMIRKTTAPLSAPCKRLGLPAYGLGIHHQVMCSRGMGH